MPYKIDEYVLELDEEDITYFYRIFSAHDVEGTEKVPRKIIEGQGKNAKKDEVIIYEPKK